MKEAGRKIRNTLDLYCAYATDHPDIDRCDGRVHNGKIDAAPNSAKDEVAERLTDMGNV